MFSNTIFRIIFISFLCYVTTGNVDDDPDQHRTMEQLVESRGFHLKTHTVTTDDGYILKLHQLADPNANADKDNQVLKPVIIQHGLFGSSNNFLVNSPFLWNNQSTNGDNLGFALALTKRYDVWLANSRGNEYGKEHINLDPKKDSEFWNFSFEQMALYDLPTVIEYVRNETKWQTVSYIGYSQGTSAMFALLAMRPEYADIVAPYIALAPVAFVEHSQTPLSNLSSLAPLLRTTGGEFVLTTKVSEALGEATCQLIKSLCSNIMFQMFGTDPSNLNETRVEVYSHFTPSSTSNWELSHWAQLVESKRFALFDFGSNEENQKAYNGYNTPPDFPLRNISSNAKIVLIHSEHDYFSDQKDMQKLRNILEDEAGVKDLKYLFVNNTKWGHLDYIFGLNAGKYYIDLLVDTLDSY